MGPARMIAESLTPKPGIREQNRHEAAVRRVQNYVRFLGYSGREMLAVRVSHFDHPPAPARSALRLRRQYGLPDILCGPLPPWQGPTHGWRAWREHKAYDRAVMRVRAYESKLLADLIRFNVDLEKYQGGEP